MSYVYLVFTDPPRRYSILTEHRIRGGITKTSAAPSSVSRIDAVFGLLAIFIPVEVSGGYRRLAETLSVQPSSLAAGACFRPIGIPTSPSETFLTDRNVMEV